MSPVPMRAVVCPFSRPRGSKRKAGDAKFFTRKVSFMEKSDYKVMLSPERCSAWLLEFKPEYALSASMLRRLATQGGSGLRATLLPLRGTQRRTAVLVRPVDVVHFVQECDKERVLA